MPAQPNAARLCGVSATFTTIPSIPHTGIPASSAAEGASSSVSGPARCQNRSSIGAGPALSRQPVNTFDVGTCHSRTHGTSARCPASWRAASAYPAPGISVIATVTRMTSGTDISRRRCGAGTRPPATAASAIVSITPSPIWRSSSPSRTKSGSHPPASTVPSRRATTGTLTTG